MQEFSIPNPFYLRPIGIKIDMRPIDLLIGLLGVYFIWAGKIVEFLLLLLLWLFMLFTSRL
jgi:hypothetical protein